MNNPGTIKIPAQLYEQLQQHQNASHFKSIDDLATFILQDYLDRKQKQPGNEAKADEQAVLKRLQDLGYM
jgi:hypothetical protein